MPDKDNFNAVIEPMTAARRLTPLECTRLQGFPDFWVDLKPKETMTDGEVEYWNRVRAEKADIEGKAYKPVQKEKMVAWYNKLIEGDGHKYAALGNSIALPFWKVLAKRISAQYDRDITTGTLFSGIGGFDKVFADVNGLQSIRWSSDIEEFPLAVLMQHFGDEDLGIEGDFYNYSK